jgi:hypothetical protein
VIGQLQLVVSQFVNETFNKHELSTYSVSGDRNTVQDQGGGLLNR